MQQNSTNVDIFLSLSTIPLLFGLVALEKISQQMEQWSQMSEEILRGDRLPVLPFPQPMTVTTTEEIL